jgi:hypothetical protein
MKTVTELRMSFIWFEAWPDLLVAPGAAPLAALGGQATYAHIFNQYVATDASPLKGLTLPWKHGKQGKSFWAIYLGGSVAKNGDQAWNHIIPLRSTPPISIDANWLNGRVFAETFFYPHGVACTINVSCSNDLTLTKPLMDLAANVRRNAKFEVIGPNFPKQLLSLEAIARELLTLGHLRSLGKQPTAISTAGRPFSIVTVVRGKDVDAKSPVNQGDDVHTIAEGLTNWNPNWDIQPPPKLTDQTLLPTDNPSPGNLLYANSHGRFVWVPTCFLPPPPQTKPPLKMGCYHRNLTLASIQMESLGQLCVMADQLIAAGNSPTGTYKDLCKRAAEVLGRLYGGAKSTYRSASITRHLLDNGWRPAINNVRAMSQFPPLTP